MASFGVVFALGAGSAAAQLLAVDSDFTIAVDDVTEGDAVRITVTLAASVNANVNTATAVTVSVSVINRQDGPNTEAEDGDRTFNGADTFMLTFPANETANATDKMTKSGSVLLQTLHDVDAENEDLTVDATLSGGGINPDAEASRSSRAARPFRGPASRLAASSTTPPPLSPSRRTATTGTGWTTRLRCRRTRGRQVTRGSKTRWASRWRTSTSCPRSPRRPSSSTRRATRSTRSPDRVESIMEGQASDLEITVVDEDGTATAAGEALMVSLMPTGDADEQDYRLSMHPVAIASGSESATTRLTASEDRDVGMEMLMLDAQVAGEAARGAETGMSEGILSLAIVDTTMKQVEAVPDELIREIVYAAKEAGAGDDGKFSPGEMIEIEASMLFTAAEGYGLTYSADSRIPS